MVLFSRFLQGRFVFSCDLLTFLSSSLPLFFCFALEKQGLEFYVAQTALELWIILTLPPKCWCYRWTSPYPGYVGLEIESSLVFVQLSYTPSSSWTHVEFYCFFPLYVVRILYLIYVLCYFYWILCWTILNPSDEMNLIITCNFVNIPLHWVSAKKNCSFRP